MHTPDTSDARSSGSAGSARSVALKARWFDGTDSRGHRVMAMIEPGEGGPQLIIAPLDEDVQGLSLPHRAVSWPQTYGKGDPKRRLTVNLREHGSLEVQSAAQWHTAYEQAGGRRKVAERMQTGWKILISLTVLSVVLLFSFFRWGTPWAATQLARFVPIGWETSMTDEFLKRFDSYMFAPSKLAAARQLALQERFAGMVSRLPEQMHRYQGYQPLWRLEFRQGRGVGANALAFPGGLIVVTDEMVELADKHNLGDAAVMGVLAHEIGHIVHRHSSRTLIEQGVLNATLSVALGDVSSMVALASTSLTTLAYSRNHEREADCFALAVMRHQKLDPLPLGTLFAALAEGGGAKSSGKKGSNADRSSKTPRDPSASLDWLSSHPDTAARVAVFRGQETMQCDTQTGRLR